MDQLQEDIDSLEAEKATLKTKLEQASKRAPRAHLTESILAEQASGIQTKPRDPCFRSHDIIEIGARRTLL